MKKKVKKVLNIISYVIMGALLTFIVYVIILSASGKEVSLFGYKMYVVKTDSMVPTIEVDTVILSHDYDSSVILDTGEVITFKFNDKIKVPNTHRIVGYYYQDSLGEKLSTYDYSSAEEFYLANPDCLIIGYRTQGDNPECKLDITPVVFENIYGVYVKNLEVISFLYGVLTSFFGFLLIILIPLFILLISQIVSMYKQYKKNKLEQELKEKEDERIALEEKLKEEAIKEYLANKKD